jgi:hypothetical protein
LGPNPPGPDGSRYDYFQVFLEPIPRSWFATTVSRRH